MNLLEQIKENAKKCNKRIVLPEGTEERTLKAADILIAEGIAQIILIGNPAEIKALAEKFELKNIGKATIIDPENHEKKEAYADLLVELRKSKGMTKEQALKLVLDPLYLATLMIKSGDADGEVAGAKKCHRRRITSRITDRENLTGYVCCIRSILVINQQTGIWRKRPNRMCRLCRTA